MMEIVVLNGPSGVGKTRCIRALGATQYNTLTSEQLIDAILEIRDADCFVDTVRRFGRISFVENMESLCGRPKTQKMAAQLVKAMAEERRIIVTGINLREKLTFFLEELESFHWCDMTLTTKEGSD